MPAWYFGRLKSEGVPIEKHLLLRDFARDPSLLTFDAATYLLFRDCWLEEMFQTGQSIVNPELI